MKCSECNYDNPADMSFCGKCGADLKDVNGTLAQDIRCPQCDATMPSAAAFCGICGHQLKISQPTKNVKQKETVDAVQPLAAILPTTTGSKTSPNSHDFPSTEAYYATSPDGAIREMISIPGGWFAMGSAANTGNGDERPRHQVELSSFFIDRAQVSNADYEKFDSTHKRSRPATSDGDDDPVVFVTYDDCLAYCRWRAEQERLPPGAYSLPTEAQWEFAAKGGHDDWIYPWGNTLNAASHNTSESQRDRTTSVHQGPLNGYGLLHMDSNVREWCRDWYADNFYSSREATGPDPTGPGRVQIVNFRVVRGASFRDAAQDFSRCAARNCAHPPNASDDVGFRCVRVGTRP